MAEEPSRRLPANPSLEHLRKQAKRLAKQDSLQLADAQHLLAQQYGHKSWAALMHAAVTSRPAAQRSELADAAAAGDLGAIRTLLARGDDADGKSNESPLQLVCAAPVSGAVRYDAAQLLLEAGANPRKRGKDGTAPLHEAAARGPLELVELLIRKGALAWEQDSRKRAPLDHARAAKQAAIVHLLDRPVLDDPRFKAAAFAIRHGSLRALSNILDHNPDLLHMRAIEPDCYPRDYFRDPKLFWFVAWNPMPPEPVPPNLLAIAQEMIARGVAQDDLTYTLELVLTGAAIRQSGLQNELMMLLLDAGAVLSDHMIIFALAEQAVAPVEFLLKRGMKLTAPVAAALGRLDALPQLLIDASPDERQAAFGLAVMHRQSEAARMALAAGADVNAYLPIHTHSTALHQAALNGDIQMLELLVERGATLSIKDKIWEGTALGWALHQGQEKAAVYLKLLAEKKS